MGAAAFAFLYIVLDRPMLVQIGFYFDPRETCQLVAETNALQLPAFRRCRPVYMGSHCLPVLPRYENWPLCAQTVSRKMRSAVRAPRAVRWAQGGRSEPEETKPTKPNPQMESARTFAQSKLSNSRKTRRASRGLCGPFVILAAMGSIGRALEGDILCA